MPAIFRLLLCGTALTVAGYLLAFTAPSWIPQAGRDLLHLPRYRADLREELAFGQLLEEKSVGLMASLQAKQQVLQDLIHERLTLMEAAKRYQELDRVRLRGRPNKYCLVWLGNCEIERYCRLIIHAVQCELNEQPSTAAAVLARLNCEFQAAADSGAFCLLR